MTWTVDWHPQALKYLEKVQVLDKRGRIYKR